MLRFKINIVLSLHIVGIVKCDLCTYETPAGLGGHRETTHPAAAELTSHYEAAHPGVTLLTCSTCQCLFTLEKSLQVHVRLHQNTTCDVCGKVNSNAMQCTLAIFLYIFLSFLFFFSSSYLMFSYLLFSSFLPFFLFFSHFLFFFAKALSGDKTDYKHLQHLNSVYLQDSMSSVYKCIFINYTLAVYVCTGMLLQSVIFVNVLIHYRD